MTDLKLDEKETHLNLTANNRGQWVAYTDDDVMKRKLDKIATGKAHGLGWVYVLDKSQVSLRQRRAKRILTDDERRVIGERLRAAREGGSK